MSILIIAVDNGNSNAKTKKIYAIADKRVGFSDTLDSANGFPDWVHLHDNAVKFKELAPGLFIGGGVCEKHSALFELEIAKAIASQKGTIKPSEVLKIASSIDRNSFDNEGFDIPTLCPIIWGMYDCGNPFVWLSEEDGTSYTKIIEQGKFYINISGGRDATKLALEKSIKNDLPTKPLTQILPDCIKLAASIDKWISPTFNMNVFDLIPDIKKLNTSETGRRMEITSDTNGQTFYDSENRPLTVFRDDVDTFTDDDANSTERSLSGMRFNKFYSSNPSNPDIVTITGNGIYSNTGAARASLGFGSSATALGSVIGYIRRAITKGANDVQAAIVGISSIADANGAFFKHMAGGTALKVEGISSFDGAIKVNDAGVVKDGLTLEQKFVLITAQGGNTQKTLKFVNGLLVSVT